MGNKHLNKYINILEALRNMINEDPMIPEKGKEFLNFISQKLEISLKYLCLRKNMSVIISEAYEKTINILDRTTDLDSLKKLFS